MSLLTEVLIIGGVAMDLVGAGVLSHAHNAESIAEIRAEIGAEGSALGEDDAIATHAQLLAEKCIGFFLLTVGLTVHLTGLVLGSPQGSAPMVLLAVGVNAAGLIVTFLWTRIVGRRVLQQASDAERKSDGEELPEQ